MNSLYDIFNSFENSEQFTKSAIKLSLIGNGSEKIFALFAKDIPAKKIVRETIVGGIKGKRIGNSDYYIADNDKILIDAPIVQGNDNRDFSNAIEIAQCCIFVVKPDDITQTAPLGITSLTEQDKEILKDKKIVLCIEHDKSSSFVPYPKIIDDGKNKERESLFKFNAKDAHFRETFESFVKENNENTNKGIPDFIFRALKLNLAPSSYIIFTGDPSVADKEQPIGTYKQFSDNQIYCLQAECKGIKSPTNNFLKLLDWDCFLESYVRNIYLKYWNEYNKRSYKALESYIRVKSIANINLQIDKILDKILYGYKGLTPEKEEILKGLYTILEKIKDTYKALKGKVTGSKRAEPREKVYNILEEIGYYSVVEEIEQSLHIKIRISIEDKEIDTKLYEYIENNTSPKSIKTNSIAAFNEDKKNSETDLIKKTNEVKSVAEYIQIVIDICNFLRKETYTKDLIELKQKFDIFSQKVFLDVN